MQTINSQLLDNSPPFPQGEPKATRLTPVQWWFKYTALPEPPEGASFMQREAVRKSRLVSIIGFFLLVLFCVYFPSDLSSMNIPSIISTLAILPVAISAFICNRARKTLAAGLIIVIAGEIALSQVVLATQPFDVTNLQLFELLVIGELLAVSLLPAVSVFVAALFNSAVITGSLLYQPKTPGMLLDLHHEFLSVLLNPVGVQLLVAAVTYLWVSSTLRALSRADRAEVIASLEHQIAQQIALVAEEKQQLEDQINQIVQHNIDIMNNRVTEKITFNEETKVLWPLINVIHSLQRRVIHAQQTDAELQRLKRAIAEYTNFVYRTRTGVPERVVQTRTDLDMLIQAFRQLFAMTPQFGRSATPGSQTSANATALSSSGGPTTMPLFSNEPTLSFGPRGDGMATSRLHRLTSQSSMDYPLSR